MKIALATVAAVLAAAAAQAATVSVVKTAVAIDPVEAVADVLAPTAFTGTFFENATGSVGGVRRSPYDTVAGLAGTGVYHSVSGGGTATYAFAQDQIGFSLLWGSPDSYNSLSFFNDGVQLSLDSFGLTLTGDEIAALPLSQPQQVGLALVAISGFTFDKVVFASGGNAFEYGLVSSTPAAVPLPAAAWMLIAGFGALVAAGRRRAA